MTKKTQNTISPNPANHHWYPFLRYVQQCAEAGKDISVNDWLISKGKVKDYKEEARVRAEAAAKAKMAAKAEAAAKAEVAAKTETPKN
tara:strand:+ start:323 stop:586 length:264 start_codon:yes stop_codon:yes gene_type:complete